MRKDRINAQLQSKSTTCYGCDIAQREEVTLTAKEAGVTEPNNVKCIHDVLFHCNHKIHNDPTNNKPISVCNRGNKVGVNLRCAECKYGCASMMIEKNNADKKLVNYQQLYSCKHKEHKSKTGEYYMPYYLCADYEPKDDKK